MPTIASSGIVRTPASTWLVRPSAATTSSNGSIADTSSGSCRSREAICASASRRRWRENADLASDRERPLSIL
ncbi:MAG TPA: hypothetical protein VHJ39_08735 [Solirubrobacteraceae bacterium]|nr:hypothetical protein [Solirubrobacteraceae bacterium]